MADKITAPPLKIIYDFGSNNGDDIPYYLKKGDLTIAVEANPLLAEQIKTRFTKEIKNKKLVVENCVLTTEDDSESVPFYLHKNSHVLSQFPRPYDSDMDNFNKVSLRAKNVINLIKKYGEPFYVKIDIEYYDQVILRELFLNNIRPVFISSESHSIEVFSLLLTLGQYKSFNLVDGYTVETKYKNHSIKTVGPEEIYSFPLHSAGPFGEDIKGPWMTPDNFFSFLAFEELGWKDIHATNAIIPDPNFRPHLETCVRKALKFKLTFIMRRYTPGFIHPVLRKIGNLIF